MFRAQVQRTLTTLLKRTKRKTVRSGDSSLTDELTLGARPRAAKEPLGSMIAII